MANRKLLTRIEAIRLIENCSTDAELRVLADHWRYEFHDESDWNGLVEGCDVMMDFVDSELSDREANNRGPQDDDITNLTAPPDLSKLDSITPDHAEANNFGANEDVHGPRIGAIQQAIADGYTHVTTYGGDVLLTLWTRRDELGLTYENGALYSSPRPANSFELELLELQSGKAVIAAQVRDRFGCVANKLDFPGGAP